VIPALVLGFTFSAAVAGLLLLQQQRPRAPNGLQPRTSAATPASTPSPTPTASATTIMLPIGQVGAGRTYRATVVPGTGTDPLAMAISWEETPETADGLAAAAANPSTP
jgi:hypothetical protein